jgi:hypothetical protein
MATTLAVGWNPTAQFVNTTTQYGDLRVGESAGTPSPLDFGTAPGGIIWWMSPDTELGYVVALPVPANNQPTPLLGITASVAFYRTEALTDEDYVYMTNYVLGAAPFNTVFSVGEANSYIQFTLNGWSSYPNF